MSLLQELLEPRLDLTQALNEALQKYITPDNEMGNLVHGFQNKNNLNALIKNPKIATSAMTQALTSYDTFVKNNRYTAQLYAKTYQERTLYSAVVKDLLKTGKYKLSQQKSVGPGTLWVLRRSDTK